MVRKELSDLALTLGAIALGLLFSGKAHKGRLAKILNDGRVEFNPNRSAYLTWPFIVGGAAWVAVIELIHNLRRPLWMLLAAYIGWIALVLLTSFPASVVTGDEGLEQTYWLRKNKQIKWKDILEINTGKKAKDVTIVGRDGTKIVHSIRLADRPRLLLELKRHCGDDLPADFPTE